MNLKSLTETDIITKVIIPNLQKSNWNINSQIAQERTFTNGKIIVRGSVSTIGFISEVENARSTQK